MNTMQSARAGNIGSKGELGEKGDTGLTGDKGTTGQKGDRGDHGLTGSKGERVSLSFRSIDGASYSLQRNLTISTIIRKKSSTKLKILISIYLIWNFARIKVNA